MDIASPHLHHSAGDGQDICICPFVMPVEIIACGLLEAQAAASVHDDDKIRGTCGETCGFRPFDRSGIVSIAWRPAECIGIQAVTRSHADCWSFHPPEIAQRGTLVCRVFIVARTNKTFHGWNIFCFDEMIYPVFISCCFCRLINPSLFVECRRSIIIAVVYIIIHRQADLFQISCTYNSPCLVTCDIQRRQQHCCQNRYNRNND